MRKSELYLLRNKQPFEFESVDLPKGTMTVVSCWGVRYQNNPPLDPWHLICKDSQGKVHCLVLPAMTRVKLQPAK